MSDSLPSWVPQKTIPYSENGEERGEVEPAFMFAYLNFLFDKDREKMDAFLSVWLPNRTLLNGDAYLLRQLVMDNAKIDGRYLRNAEKKIWERITLMEGVASIDRQPFNLADAFRTLAAEELPPDADDDAITKVAAHIERQYYRHAAKEEAEEKRFKR